MFTNFYLFSLFLRGAKSTKTIIFIDLWLNLEYFERAKTDNLLKH